MPEHDPPRAERLAALMRAAAADKAARDDAVRVVERWNAHVAADEDIWWWSRSILTVAGMPWADVYCPGCKTTRSIDVRIFPVPGGTATSMRAVAAWISGFFRAPGVCACTAASIFGCHSLSQKTSMGLL